MSEPVHERILDSSVSNPHWQIEAHAPGREVQWFELNSTVLTIGRSSEAQIQLDSVRVSRRHAELSHESIGHWKIRDLGSRNGTRVNGLPILADTMVRPSDQIQIGEFELHLRLNSPPRLAETAQTQTTLLLDAGTPSEFTMLGTAPAPRLGSRHLAMVHSLGHRLLETPAGDDRRAALCRWMLDSEIRGTMAVILRVDRNAPAAEPQVLHSSLAPSPTVAHPKVLRSVVDAVLQGEQPILAGGTAASGLTVSFPEDDRGISAAIACPLKLDAKTADVLYVTVPREFGTVDWLALVALAAEQYKKAELQVEARRITKESSALQEDLKKARQIQMSLVPQQASAPGLDIAIGFEPCRWIGGDYVNVLPGLDGQVLLAIADVSGKGLSAALVASGVHSIVHSFIRSGRGLVDLAQTLNQYLLESMDRQSFVTMIAVLFDPATGKVQFMNAGHPPLMLLDPDGKLHEMRYAHNAPLGVIPMTPEIDSFILHHGQLLFLYTDGLNEMTDAAKKKMVGLAGLGTELSSLYVKQCIDPLNVLCASLQQRLNEIQGAAPATDDRTFLMARRSEAEPSET